MSQSSIKAGHVNSPMKLLLKSHNLSVEWKMTSKHESTMKNTQPNHYNKQPNNTRLTQIWHQPNLTWNGARQTIVVQRQVSCRMKNDQQAWEYNEKHITQSLQQATKQHQTHTSSTSRQSGLESCLSNYLWREPTYLQNEKWQASMRVQWKTHDNTIITTSNQTTLNSHKLDIKAISVGIVPVKLLLKSHKTAVE